MSPDEPIKPETEDRLRNAMQSYATRREPSDAWESVAGKVDRSWWQRVGSPRVWGPGLVLAAAAAVLLFFVMGGGESEQSEELEVGDPTAEEDQQSIIAVTADDKLVEIVPGEEASEILDLGEIEQSTGFDSDAMRNADLAAQVTVGPDGSVYLPRSGSAPVVDCSNAPGDLVALEVSRLFADIQLWRIAPDGSFAPAVESQSNGFAPAVGPDGSLAFITPDSCRGGFAVGLRIGQGGVTWLALPGDIPTTAAPIDLIWEAADRLAVLYREDEALTRVVFDVDGRDEVERGVVAHDPAHPSVVGAGKGGLALADVSPDGVLDVGFLDNYAEPRRRLFSIPPIEAGSGWYEPVTVDGGDPSGHVLLTAQKTLEGARLIPPDLYLWEGEGEPRGISEGIVAAAWGPPTTTEIPTTDPPTTDDTVQTTATSLEVPEYLPPFAVLRGDGVTLVEDEQETRLMTLDEGEVPYLGKADSVEFAVALADHDVYLSVEGNEDEGRCAPELRRYESPQDGDAAPYDVISPHGAYPAISPDGTKLAYVDLEPADDAGTACNASLAIRDLITGDTRFLIDETTTTDVVEGEVVPEMSTLRWSPDGGDVAFERRFGEVDRVLTVWLADPSVTDLSAAQPIHPPVPGDADDWSLAGWAFDGDLVLSTTCRSTCASPIEVVVLEHGSNPADSAVPRGLYKLPAKAFGVSAEWNNSVLYFLGPRGGDGASLRVPIENHEELVYDDVLGAAWLGF